MSNGNSDTSDVLRSSSNLDAQGARGLLSESALLELAQRCRVPLDGEVLAGLKKHRWLIPARGGVTASGYTPAHLWLAHRYFQLVNTPRHPFVETAAPEPAASDLIRLEADADALAEALSWVFGKRVGTPPESIAHTVEALQSWAMDNDQLGTIRDVLKLMRKDVRSQLKGEALLVELVWGQIEKLIEAAGGDGAAMSRSRAPLSSGVMRARSALAASRSSSTAVARSSSSSSAVSTSAQKSAPTTSASSGALARSHEPSPSAGPSASPSSGSSQVAAQEPARRSGSYQTDGSGSAIQMVKRSASSSSTPAAAPPPIPEFTSTSSGSVPARRSLKSSPDREAPSHTPTEPMMALPKAHKAGEASEPAEPAEAARSTSDPKAGPSSSTVKPVATSPAAPNKPAPSEEPPNEETRDTIKRPPVPSSTSRPVFGVEPKEKTEAEKPTQDLPLATSTEDPGLTKSAPGGEPPGSATLKKALERARQSTASMKIKREQRQKLRALPGLAAPEEETQETESPAPEIDAPEQAPVVEKTIEEKIAALNERREVLLANKQWAELAQLYEDGIDLFTQRQEQAQVYFNIGVIYENELERLDKADQAYNLALSSHPTRPIWDALLRLCAEDARWDDLLAAIDRVVDAVTDEDLRVDMRVKRAELLVKRFDEGEVARKLFADILREDHPRPRRDRVLFVLADLVREDVSTSFLLGGASLLEADWGVTRHADKLVELYEQVYDTLTDRGDAKAAEAVIRLASIYQANDRHTEAFAALSRALTANPEREDTHMRLLELAEELDNLDELAAIYEDEIDRLDDGPARAAVANKLAALWERLGEPERARGALQIAAEGSPLDTQQLHALAGLHESSGDVSGHVGVLGDMLKHVEGDARLDVIMQMVNMRTSGLTDGASQAERDALDLDETIILLQEAFAQLTPQSRMTPEFIDCARRLFSSENHALTLQVADLLEQYHGRYGEYDEIVDLYETLADHHQEHGDHASAGSLLTRVGHLHEEKLSQPQLAFAAYGKAIRRDPNQTDAMSRLQTLAIEQSRWADLAALLEDVVDQGNVDIAPLLRQLVGIYREHLDDGDAAQKVARRLLDMDPNDRAILGFMEEWHTGRGEFRQALDFIDRRVEAETSIQAKKDHLARSVAICLDHLDDPRKTGERLMEILHMDPEDSELLQVLLAVYREHDILAELPALMAKTMRKLRDRRLRSEIGLMRVDVFENELDDIPGAIGALNELRGWARSDAELQQTVFTRLEELYTANGDHEAAYEVVREQYEVARKKKGGRANRDVVRSLLYQLAHMAESRLDSPERAAEHMQEILGDDPSDISVLEKLESLLERAEKWKDLLTAIDIHVQAMIKRSDRSGAAELIQRQARIAREKLNDENLELQYLQSLAVQTGGQAEAVPIDRMIDLSRKEGRWEDTVKLMEKQLDTLPEGSGRVELLLQMADICLVNLNARDRGLRHLRQLLKLAPGHDEAMKKVKKIYRANGEFEELAALWRTQLDLSESLGDKERVEQYRDLGALYENQLGQKRQAAGVLERALAEAAEVGDAISVDTLVEIRDKLLDLYLALQDWSAALSHLEPMANDLEGSSMRPQERAQHLINLGTIALTCDSSYTETAEMFYLRAIGAEPTGLTARQALANLYIEQQMWEAALEMLEYLSGQIVQFQQGTERGLIYSRLGQCHQQLGQDDKAAEMFKVALQHDPTNSAARAALK